MTTAQAVDIPRFRMGQVVIQSGRAIVGNIAILIAVTVIVYVTPNWALRGVRVLENGLKLTPDVREALGLALTVASDIIDQAFAVSVAVAVLGARAPLTTALVDCLKRTVKALPVAVTLAIVFNFGALILDYIVNPAAGAFIHDPINLSTAIIVSGAVSLAITTLLIAIAGVAAPVLAMEQTGPIRTLSRSVQLLAGHRWALAALFLALSITVFLLDAAAFQWLIRPMLSHPLKAGEFAGDVEPLAIFFVARQVVWSVIIAISYRELLIPSLPRQQIVPAGFPARSMAARRSDLIGRAIPNGVSRP